MRLNGRSDSHCGSFSLTQTPGNLADVVEEPRVFFEPISPLAITQKRP